MTKGFDCAAPLSASVAAAFKADGYEFVVRYIDTNQSSWKRLSSEEAQIITDAGLEIISVFERMGDRASINGLRGAADGLVALQAAQDLGQPEGSTIYYAVDYDAQPSDMDSIENYIRAAATATPQYPTGIYGSYAVIEEMKKRGACSHFWQTYAWSSNLQSSLIQIYQYNNDITVHGIRVDLDTSFGNEGWWNLMPLISKDDADKVIGLLGEAYRQGVTKITLQNGTVITVDQNEIHRLANVQRAASGQPVQK
jgi:hypothetical protein